VLCLVAVLWSSASCRFLLWLLLAVVKQATVDGGPYCWECVCFGLLSVCALDWLGLRVLACIVERVVPWCASFNGWQLLLGSCERRWLIILERNYDACPQHVPVLALLILSPAKPKY
jgi:hypothetical protein